MEGCVGRGEVVRSCGQRGDVYVSIVLCASDCAWYRQHRVLWWMGIQVVEWEKTYSTYKSNQEMIMVRLLNREPTLRNRLRLDRNIIMRCARVIFCTQLVVLVQPVQMGPHIAVPNSPNHLILQDCCRSFPVHQTHAERIRYLQKVRCVSKLNLGLQSTILESVSGDSSVALGVSSVTLGVYPVKPSTTLISPSIPDS